MGNDWKKEFQKRGYQEDMPDHLASKIVGQTSEVIASNESKSIFHSLSLLWPATAAATAAAFALIVVFSVPPVEENATVMADNGYLQHDIEMMSLI